VVENKYEIEYTIDKYFGDFAAMIGALLGLSVVKFAIGVPSFYFSWKYKSLLPTEEIFGK